MKGMSMKEKAMKCCALIDRLVEVALFAAFALMLIIGGMQVFSRYALKHSLSWSEEFQKYMHIWIIFLAVPLAYKRGAHIGMRVISDRFPEGVRRVLAIAVDVLWFALGAVMAYYTINIMKVARFQTSPGLGIRMDVVYLCIVVGGLYLCLNAVRSIAGHFDGGPVRPGKGAG